MNVLLLDPADLEGGAGGPGPLEGEVTLPAGDRRARHLIEVLGVEPGRTIRAGLVGGPLGQAEVLAAGRGRPVRLRVVLDQPASLRPPIDLLLAVPRPKVVGRVLETAAALGVGRIDLTNAWRVDKSYFDSPRLDPARLVSDVRRGCEQGATTWLPAVSVHRRLMPLLAAPPGEWGSALRVVAQPRAATALEEAAPPGWSGRAVLAIGPEGGWIARELDSLAQVGFAPAHLGPGVLRVDSAVAAALAQLLLLRRLPAPAEDDQRSR